MSVESVTLERKPNVEPRHLNTFMVGECDAALDEAVRAVEEGRCAEVTVTMSFKVKRDEKDGVVCDWTLKDVQTRKGKWQPTAFGQMRLLEE